MLPRGSEEHYVRFNRLYLIVVVIVLIFLWFLRQQWRPEGLPTPASHSAYHARHTYPKLFPPRKSNAKVNLLGLRLLFPQQFFFFFLSENRVSFLTNFS